MPNDDFKKQFDTAMNIFKKDHYKITQEALKEVNQEIRQTMESASPPGDTGKFRSGWKTKEYPNLAYTWNGPLTNVIEYSRRGPQAFIMQTFRRHEMQFGRSVIKKIQNKLRRK